MILLLDNYDSFTYNLVDYFAQLGKDCKVVKNDVPFQDIISEDYEAVLLSPGPGRPKDAGNLMSVLEHYHDKLPVLGICLGHQAIGEFFGAELIKAKRPMHGKISKITHSGDCFFSGLKENVEIVRYHSLILKNIPEKFDLLASTEDQELMAMRHNSLFVSSLQFHPEAVLTEGGLTMLSNWLDTYHLSN